MTRFPIIALVLVTAALPARAAVRPVAVGELTNAMTTAKPGDTLRLQAGVHRGAQLVTIPLTLVGESGAVIEGDGTGTVLTIAADDVVVRDLAIRGSGADLGKDDAVVLLREARRVTIEGCRVDARAFGIYLKAGGENRVLRNSVYGDRSLPVERRGNGIHLWHTEQNEIRDNRLQDVRDGVYLSFAHDNEIHGNHARSLRYGIHYMYSERNDLARNRFSECTGGIALMFSMRNTITDNEAIGNQRFGILCQQIEHSTLEGNRVADNGRGFFIKNSVDNLFRGNQLESNGVGAFLTAGSEKNVFTANHFVGNLVQVFEDRRGLNSFHDRGRGNLWSDYPGFDWNGDGIGETPYRLQTSASALLAHRPITRWFWMSPMLGLLDWWDGQMNDAEVASLDPFPVVDLGAAEATVQNGKLP